jgi:glycosyltransferase involved in cell wall biosynthesis
MRHYDTALRPYVQKRLEEIQQADILVGIPCYNNEETIVHVVQMVSHGLHRHFRDRRAVIMIADGGSTDDSRDRVTDFQLKPWQEKVITIYRGVGGKGSALRALFEAAHRLGVSVCVCVDSDLRSINPDWVRYLIEPVLERDFEFVAPVYSRYKYDGTITNNIVYNLVRALYGKRIRQPIGGDFAFGRRLARHYLGQDVWGTDIARFGIDIWMTLSAVVERARVCQANLGVKIHDAKDPAEALGPMFRQVCGTFFALLEAHESYWTKTGPSEAVPVFGLDTTVEPEPIRVNQERMVREFSEGWRLFGPVYREIFSREVSRNLEQASGLKPKAFQFPVEIWVKLLYELAARYHQLGHHRIKLLTMMTPLYLGRVASFITRTRDMSSEQAELLVEEQAQVFEQHKPYMLQLWEASADNHRLSELLAREG